MTALVALAFLLPLGLSFQANARSRALDDAQRRAALVAGALTVTGDARAVQKAITEATADGVPPVVHRVATIPTANSRASDADVTAATSRGPVVADVPGGAIRLEPVKLANAIAVVEVFVPAHRLTDGVARTWWSLIALAVGLIAASVVVADRIAARTVRSARSLVHAALAVGDGDLGVRVQPSGPRELAEAGYAFNRMSDRLGVFRTDERELVADLSHRLRTPLTVLRLDADALDSDDTSIGTLSAAEVDKRRTIRRIREAIVTLEGEVDVLINTTRKAVATQSQEPATCDVSEVVRDRMVFWSALAGDQNRHYEVIGAHTRIIVPVARGELAAALDAVLGNVFRYTPQGTAFEVAVTRRDGYVAVRVDDAGEGIDNPDRALRRGSSERGSTGLGLDIARRAARSAGGSVSIDRARLGGASVVMLFADPTAIPKQASRFGLVGRISREPGGVPRWPRHPRD